MIELTKADLAAALNCSLTTLERLEKKHGPITSSYSTEKGNRRYFSLADFATWLQAKGRDEIKSTKSGELFDYEQEKARLTHFQANKCALEYQTMAKEVIPAEEVEKELVGMAVNIRKAVMALPRRVAYACANETREAVIEEYLEDECRALLTELGDVADSSEHLEAD